MIKIEEHFSNRFRHWEIVLHPDDIAKRQRSEITKAGWNITYLFGSDDKGEYLDYYASHRHPGDSHTRVYEDGTTEDLPAIQSIRQASEDPEEDARLKSEHFQKNRQIAKMLAEKAFGTSGNEPGGVSINRFLSLNKFEEE